MYTHDQILDCIENTIKSVYQFDNQLIKFDVHEQAFAHRFAVYIERNIDLLTPVKKYAVDCEYNRAPTDLEIIFKNADGTFPISIPSIDEYTKKNNIRIIRPDIIVHRRGTNKKNLIVIEIKKDANSGLTKITDAEKIELITSPTNDLKYKYGFEIRYSKSKMLVYEYQKGKLTNRYIFLKREQKLEKIVKRRKSR